MNEHCPCQTLSTVTFMLWDKKFSDKLISNRRPRDLRKEVLLRNAKMELTARYICYSVVEQSLESDDESKVADFDETKVNHNHQSRSKHYFRRKKRQLTTARETNLPVKKSNLNARS